MQTITTVFFGAAVLATAFFPLAFAYPTSRQPSVIYTLNNNPSNASIIAMMLSENGTVVTSNQIPTGGLGLSGTTGVGQPNVGALFGSNAVTAGDNYLFTVNAGSNTLSMFYIEPSSPMRPVLVGSPANTLGEFPMSVAYSSSLQTVCVLNGGRINGVSCFSVNATTGLTALDTAPRSISRGLNQTTPPVGPFSTASDIMFNPSSSALTVSVKGSPLLTPVAPGYIFSWPVVNGSVSYSAVVTSIPTIILDFSLTYTYSDFDLLITDPALGADFLGVTSNLNLTVANPVNITYQEATCWSYFDPVSNAVFVTDAAQTNVTVLNPVDGSLMSTINYDPTNVGGLDNMVVGSSLYILSQAATIVNIDISGIAQGKTPRQVQSFVPLPSGPNGTLPVLQGIASYSPSSAS